MEYFCRRQAQEIRFVYQQMDIPSEGPKARRIASPAGEVSKDGRDTREVKKGLKALEKVAGTMQLASDLPPGSAQEINELKVQALNMGAEVQAASGRIYRNLGGKIFYNSQGLGDNTWGRIDEKGTVYVIDGGRGIQVQEASYGMNLLLVPKGEENQNVIYDQSGRRMIPDDKGVYEIKDVVLGGPSKFQFINGRIVQLKSTTSSGRRSVEPDEHPLDAGLVRLQSQFIAKGIEPIIQGGFITEFHFLDWGGRSWTADGNNFFMNFVFEDGNISCDEITPHGMTIEHKLSMIRTNGGYDLFQDGKKATSMNRP